MPKKPSRKTLKRKADKLWADLIKAEGKCEAEGYSHRCNGYLQAAHIIPRRYLSVRWDLLNGVALCAGHHMGFTHKPLEFEEWVTTYVLKPATYNGLRRKAMSANGPPDYGAVIEGLEESV